MRSLLFRAGTAVALMAALGVAPVAQAGRPPVAQAQSLQGVDFWTEPSGASIFRDTLPTKESGRAIALDTAINEEESAQVVLRSAAAFTISGVTFSALTAGAQQIAAGNLSYNFVTYKNLNRNSPNIYPQLRKAPGDFPDPLSNARTIDVAARSTQSIWLTVAVPKGTAAGLYSGTATVSTTKGDLQVPVSADVRAVTLPDAKDGAFSTSLWNRFTGEISWAPDGKTIEDTFHYARYSDQYFAMMEKVADQMRRHRTNTVTLPLVNMLLDGNTTVTDNTNATGTYSFDWSRIDQMVEFYDSRGVMKKLEGFWVSADTNNYGHPADGIRDVEIVDRPSGSGKGQRSYANWDTPKAKNFMKQFLPALKAHVEAKGWADKYWMHVGDEPSTDQGEADWKSIAAEMRQYWPGVKIGDAVFQEPFAGHVAADMDVVIPCIPTYDAGKATYDALRNQGKDLYFYGCERGNFLNRYLDQPQFDQRLTIWYAYARGANGYLHYAMDAWTTPLDSDDSKGDHYVVWPDVANNTIESTVRYESLRDGIEDYETLNLLGKTDPALAKDLATALTQAGDKYSMDIGYQNRIRRLVLDAAAGKPVVASDVALNTTATASTWTSGSEAGKAIDGSAGTAWRPAGVGDQWLQVDLGRQIQLDGIRLNWAGAHPAYKVQISYDGARWTTASPVPAGAGDSFVGINGKTRLLRLEVAAGSAYGLNSLEVAGSPLGKVNLLGGRGYTVSPAPSDQPDSGFESTDGLLADDWSDGRTYGFGSGQSPATVTFDLGAVQTVDSARIHAYEEYPAYRPDQVTIATSTDGSTWTQKGWLPGTTNDQSKIWYDFDFPAAAARYLKVTFQKTFTADARVMLIDEIELYGSDRTNLAAGAAYTKSATPAGGYPDTGNKESTDGVIAGGHPDGFGYGYNFPAGSTGKVSVTVDLGSAKQFSEVAVRDNFDNATKYSPDTVRVYAGNSPTSLTKVGESGASVAQWFRIPVAPVTARYVQVEYEKYSVGVAADWIFADEIAVY